jgi:phospholipid/cholesterol/gamma-HCH transport system substrate-binding protein
VSSPGSTGATQNGRSSPPSGAANGARAPRRSTVARAIAAAALVTAIAVVLVLVLDGSGSYDLRVRFQDASGLVSGDNVLIGPATVGTVSSIGLTRDGQAEVTLHLHGTGRLHRGTVARIAEDSLSGIASKYVELEPGPANGPVIDSGETIGEGRSYSEVNIDELFNSFNRATRTGLSNLIRGEATSLRGKGRLAHRTLEYLAPGLQSTSQVTRELARDEPAFDGLLVQGADAMRTLAARSDQLSQLIANSSSATGAIARQSRALQTALSLLPTTLRRSTHTFAGLDTTLDALDPVVAAAKPASQQLPQFARGLNALSRQAIPTVARLDDLIADPSGAGDLTTLALAAPGLATQADRAFPTLIRNFAQSRAQLDYLREYTPDVVAALANVGQASSYYDANGHYARTMPMLLPFTTDATGQLVTQNPADRYAGLTRVTRRCPGAAVQAAPDGSTPRATPGCAASQVPPGP